MIKRKVCVVTGTRAEYGLLHWLMKEIKDDPVLELQTIVTGMHLSPEFGLTYKQIEKDGFHIDRKVEMLLSADTPSAISKSTGLGLIGCADAFTELKPDLIILLGDRFEIFSAAIAASFSRIPIVHIHGGEITAGAVDEFIRHSITKMAWWHVTVDEEYQKRVIQLGENPERVFIVNSLGSEAIKKFELLSKEKFIEEISFALGPKNLLVTFHPVTLEKETSRQHFHELLAALDELDDTHVIFTAPNADSDGRIIKQMIDEYVSVHMKTSISFITMGHLNYFSALQFVDGVVGNSSSGIFEAPVFKIGTINIGDRQKGRLKPESVIDCDPNKNSIINAVEKLYSKNFQEKLKIIKNTHVESATKKIMNIIKTNPIPKELKKGFYDL